MTPRRRDIDDEDDASGALTAGSQGAWKLLALIGAILTAAGVVIGADRFQAASVARAVAEERVRPVEQRLDAHLENSKAMREVMDRWVDEQRRVRKMNDRRFEALCRATRADCPMVEE